VDLGELFDSAGLLPSDMLYDEGGEDDDAASTTSSSSTGSAWGGGDGSGGGGAAGGGGWASTGGGGGGGGVRDLAAVMMFQPRRLQRLKRRYEQLLRISLQVCGCVKGGVSGLCWWDQTPSPHDAMLQPTHRPVCAPAPDTLRTRATHFHTTGAEPH
jgi:hypothetical protein